MNVISAKALNLSSNIWQLYSAVSLVLTRLWIWAFALPAGLVLSVLLVANDFSAAKVISSILVSSHESVSFLQPGSTAGTYQWKQCADSVPSKLTRPAVLTCKDPIIREGTLAEAIAPGAAALAQLYVALALTCVMFMTWVMPRSSYALRYKLACALRLRKPD